MLSAATLNRVGQAYRRGYQDGYALRPYDDRSVKGTFGSYDYEKGRNAGLNDRYWSQHSGEMSRDEFMRKYY